MYFKNRVDAGKKLAKALGKYKDQNVVVYALPRGGVVTAVEVAKYLNAPLDLVITRKIGHPFSPEYAIGAVAENGHHIFNDAEIVHVDKKWLKTAVQKEQTEARRRREKYLAGHKSVSIQNKIAILIDDGIATGLTIRVAIEELKHHHPKKIIVAVPIIPFDIAEQLKPEVDELIVLSIPSVYSGAVGAYYDEFLPVSDEELIQLLKKH